jgi:hypothetical protein
MSKTFVEYKYNNKKYIFVEYISIQGKDGSITKQVKLFDTDYCIYFYLKEFFDKNFVKLEYTRSQKTIKKLGKIAYVISSVGWSGILIASILFGMFMDIQHTNKIEALLNQKNVCESVQNVILKK